MTEVESYVKDNYIKLWVSEGAYLPLTNLAGRCTFFFFKFEIMPWDYTYIIEMARKKQPSQSKSKFISKLVLIIISGY